MTLDSRWTRLFRVMSMLAGIVTVFAALAFSQGSPQDVPQWRGPNRDGSASSFASPKSWPEKLTLKWKVDVGAGYATPIVVGNRVYTLARQDGNEVMMALDAATGKTV